MNTAERRLVSTTLDLAATIVDIALFGPRRYEVAHRSAAGGVLNGQPSLGEVKQVDKSLPDLTAKDRISGEVLPPGVLRRFWRWLW